ncbi:MAG TPA: acyl carrier protein [Syntrophales bacterium]|nr:acyl carrier protein [Syntrophales bacterium]HOM08397.1 acyl carrier protein [Syntrophales bacterium]
MNAIEKIIAGIVELFPEVGDLTLDADTPLGAIPGFDSMAAVNLQTYLEEVFKTTVFLEILNAETTIGELAVYLTDPQKMAAALKR